MALCLCVKNCIRIAVVGCLWFLNFCIAASVCPARCRCVDQRNAIPSTYCTKLRLSGVPVDIANHTEYLSLRENVITKLDNEDFKQLRELKRLDLMNNAISNIMPLAFKNGRKLLSLNLGNNRIRNLPKGVFDNLPVLEELYINDNFLTELPEDLFSSLPNLKRLHLQNNMLHTLPSDLFTKLKNLVLLNLSHNQINVVERNTFKNLRHLMWLQLNDNKIVSLEFQAFEDLEMLGDLQLHSNNLRVVHSSLFEGKRKLSRFSLHGNPLNCDCNLKWLHATMATGWPVVDQAGKTRCKGPHGYEGRSLTELEAEALHCYGTWNAWGEWSPCDKSCNGGFRYRRRVCEINARSDDSGSCNGLSSESQMCNGFSCTRSVVSSWNEWSPCSASCDHGVQIRTRKCINPLMDTEEDMCSEPLSDIMTCFERHCRVGDEWTAWTEWSVCNRSCGLGMTTRSRRCAHHMRRMDSVSCAAGQVEHQNKICIIALCPPRTHWSSWSEFTTCSVLCGSGFQVRSRTCLNEYNVSMNIVNVCPGSSEDTRECSADSVSCAVNGVWSSWGDWSGCDVVFCKRFRDRTCSQPAPSNGGRDCIGSSREQQHCDANECVIHSIWNAWQAWSSCSATCDGGVRTRFRTCPGGESSRVTCGAKRLESEACGTLPCSLSPTWSGWSTWSECAGGCHGKQVRKRICRGDAFRPCKGRDKERQPCVAPDCELIKEPNVSRSKCVGRGGIENGFEKLTQNGTDGLVAEYSCNKYYKLKGTSNKMTCLFGRWAPVVPPYCVPVCGRSNSPNNNRARLFGGTLSAPHSWPWQVAIEVRLHGEGWRLRCGGSLISEQWVLTAGHCLYDLIPQRIVMPHQLKVFVGVHNISQRYQNSVAELHTVQIAIPYPKFDYPSLDNDLALIKLNRKIILGDHARPVCLPTSGQKDHVKKGRVGTVIGWGTTLNERASELLQELELPVVSRKECEQAYHEVHYNISRSMFCAGTKYGGYDTCKGDSGGGYLFYDEKKRKWTVQGIVSWGGNKCGEEGKFSVYTKVALFTNWIRNVLRHDEYTEDQRSS